MKPQVLWLGVRIASMFSLECRLNPIGSDCVDAMLRRILRPQLGLAGRSTEIECSHLPQE